MGKKTRKIESRVKFLQYHEETAIKRMLEKGPPVAGGPIALVHYRTLYKEGTISNHMVLYAYRCDLKDLIDPDDIPLTIFIQEPHYPVIIVDNNYYPVIKMKKHKFAIHTTHKIPQESIDYIDSILAKHIELSLLKEGS